MEHDPPKLKNLFWKSGNLVRPLIKLPPGRHEQYLYSVQTFVFISDATVGFEVQKKPVLEIRHWSCDLLPVGFYFYYAFPNV